ncbi:hypothetical protein QFZ38_005469 [Pseudomonas cedrina]|nr:hypothetical protein [Pseudomonas cedrina]
MPLNIMLLAALPGIVFMIYQIFKRRSTLGMATVLSMAVMLGLSYGVGLSAGCTQPFCIDWNSSMDKVERK